MVRIPDHCQPAAKPIKTAIGLTGNESVWVKRINNA
jgi:hypothetical protein